MTEWIGQSHRGDCRDLMRAMAADGVRVQTIVTSPPYWGLRSYLPDEHPDKQREIGQEPTLREFIDTLVGVFELARELLADDGTLWLNMGDAYNTGTTARRPSSKATNHGRWSDNRSDELIGSARAHAVGMKTKDLMGQPWRLAFALQDAGWYLRQDIIWHKPNPMPESVRDRCTKAHEYLFLLSKSERYYFDAAAIAQPLSESSIERLSQPTLQDQRGSDRVPGKTNGPMKAGGPRFGGNKYGDDGRDESRTKSGNEWCGESGRANRRSVWTIATQSYRGAHFATFPEALVEPCVLAGSRPGDVVFDPFFGSGTTGQVAQQLGRRFLGCELNPEYESLQRDRLCQPGLALA
ncbi:DNA methyltransferase [Burkholderia ubonensis]|uniref:DNA-methyltransferase n=1 Tax=Burkholderia ubonensis TaxID=101571 RepID=UPI0007543A64|nr:site-specific DNA-methyltransferase [Burkholderia ubonensis]KVR27807.1 DNA methyltransferase [Burkholderia ubonensis]